ncbi:MAG: type II toxin-antitoxin system PemK/MazF family toxin [Planctomycetaceae bacterium]|nr:type II toxin-antitoxin system PemK/MazF family toxin [Planctomycetaceae bacterium]
MTRGDLVIVDFRPVNPNAGVRPALVVQNDRDNARMGNTVVVQVTSNVRRAVELTQILIDPAHPDWSLSGLQRPSVVNRSTIYTIEQADMTKTVGRLSPTTMEQVAECLRTVLEL